MSMVFATIAIFTLMSVISGAIGAVLSLNLYGSLSQQRALKRAGTRLLLGLMAGLVLGVSQVLLLGLLWWLGLHTPLTILVAFISTVAFVTLGTYVGWTIGIKIVERRVDGSR
jgi:hypothetical protein